MQVILCASRTLANIIAKTTGAELPRITSLDGKNVGTQQLHSDSQQIAWQCQYVPAFYKANHGAVIAIESFSRFIIFIPATKQIDVNALEKTLLHEWFDELNYWHVASGTHDNQDSKTAKNHIKIENIHWRSNTDLSINGHVSDAAQWLQQYLEDYNLSSLTFDHAKTLGRYLNQQKRRAPKGQADSKSFIPYQRFLALHNEINRVTNLSATKEQRESQSNVVFLSDYRK